MNTATHPNVIPLRRDGAAGYLPLFEALLFTVGRPLTAEQLAQAAGCSTEAARSLLNQLDECLNADDRGLCLVWVGDAAQLAPKPQYQQAIAMVRQTDTDRQLAVVREFCHVQQVRGRRPGSIQAYGQFLERFVKTVGKPVDQIGPRDIRLFLMGEESRGNNRKTIATKVGYLRSFFNWLEREELIERNPMRRIDQPKTDPPAPRYLTREEVELVREACKNLTERCLVEVLYGSGLRVSEAVALDWSDIGWQERTITVREGKGGKTRIVPMSTKAALLLRQLREHRKDDDNPWVFQSRYHQRMAKETIERRVRLLGRRAHLNGTLTPHRFRHSLATHLLESGVPIDVVQAILGHSTVATTQIYARTQRSSVEMWYRRVIG